MAVTTYRYNVPGNLVMENRGGTKSAYRFDARGSTTQLINTSATITDTFQFDSFGNQVSRTGTTATPFTFMAGISMYMPSGISPVFGVFGPLRWDPKAGGFTTGNSALLFELWLIRLAVERFAWWMWAQDFLKKVFSGGWPFIIAEPVPRINDPYRTPWPYPPKPRSRPRSPVPQPGPIMPRETGPATGRGDSSTRRLRRSPNDYTLSNPFSWWHYGNFCGASNVKPPGAGYLPKDCLDLCCLKHDRCIEAHDEAGYREDCQHYCCDCQLYNCAFDVFYGDTFEGGSSDCCEEAPSRALCLQAAFDVILAFAGLCGGTRITGLCCPPCLAGGLPTHLKWAKQFWYADVNE